MQLDFHHQHKTFIVAVSGGVDSVVLLHALVTNYPNNNYIVAHVNHGIRNDANEDAVLVEKNVLKYGIPFEYTDLHLGKSASEAEARTKRYDFLRTVAKKHNAQAIITAHHQDDVIETLFINLIRGTGRRGIASLKSTQEIYRPLLDVPKDQIYNYAKQHKLAWREDSTNADKTYLRNNIRHTVVKTMTSDQRLQAISIIQRMHSLNATIDKELTIVLRRGQHKGSPVLNRRWFSLLPHAIAQEVAHFILRDIGAQDIDKKTIDRAVVAIKTMQPGKRLQLHGVDIILTKRSARFKNRGKTDEKPV